MKQWTIAVLLGLVAVSACAQANGEPKSRFPETKKQFVKLQLQWAKKDPRWNPKKEGLEARFDQLDTNGDGLLAQEEWDNRPKKKKK